MSITLAFKNQLPIVVTTKFALNRFNSVLKRFCGLEEGFSEPDRDSNGHLTFPIRFDISRDIFLRCIAFLRTGVLDSEDHIIAMSDVFNVFGGFEEWDAFLQHRESQRVAKIKAEVREREQREQNPLTPEDNILGLFVFEPHPYGFTHSGEWEATTIQNGAAHMYWWRKRIED